MPLMRRTYSAQDFVFKNQEILAFFHEQKTFFADFVNQFLCRIGVWREQWDTLNFSYCNPQKGHLCIVFCIFLVTACENQSRMWFTGQNKK